MLVQLTVIIILKVVDNEIFTWGTGEYGELGQGKNKFSNVPIGIYFENKNLVKKIQCGYSYTIFLNGNFRIIIFRFRENKIFW